jgi:hypothetical protein
LEQILHKSFACCGSSSLLWQPIYGQIILLKYYGRRAGDSFSDLKLNPFSVFAEPPYMSHLSTCTVTLYSAVCLQVKVPFSYRNFSQPVARRSKEEEGQVRQAAAEKICTQNHEKGLEGTNMEYSLSVRRYFLFTCSQHFTSLMEQRMKQTIDHKTMHLTTLNKMMYLTGLMAMASIASGSMMSGTRTRTAFIAPSSSSTKSVKSQIKALNAYTDDELGRPDKIIVNKSMSNNISRQNLPPSSLPNGGKITMVGSGPGDPDLLTVAAHKILTDPSILVISDRLVSPEILELIKGEIKVARKLPGCAEEAQMEVSNFCERSQIL